MGIVEKFEKLTEDFVSISKEEKANVIKQMLIIMHKRSQNGNIIYDDFLM